MPATTTPTRDDVQVRDILDASARALRAKDIAALMSHYAPDMVTFDLMPLHLQGADAYRKNFERWFASVQGSIDYEMRDVHLTIRDDVAFCHYLGHVKTTRTTGVKTEYWVRVTAGFQRRNGRWLITHEHVSVPFVDMESMQASLASSQRSVPG
jgi:uncharacterized protein (TIGR02246 family)